MPPLYLQRSQRPQPGPSAAPANHPLPASDDLLASLGPGDPLSPDLVASLSPALGRDLSSVRMHAESPLPATVGARAFTVGNHVAFAPGEYSPHSGVGRALLVHELAHVVQQSGGTGAVQGADLSYDAYEAEAEAAADAVAAGRPVERLSPVSGPTAQGDLLDDATGALSSAWDAGTEAVGDLAETGIDFLVEQFWKFVRTVAPDAEPYLRNPSLLWNDIIEGVTSGIDALVGEVFSAFGEGGLFDDLAGFFSDVGAGISEIVQGIASGDCGPIADALGSALGLFSSFTEALFEPIQSVLKTVSSAIHGVIDVVVRPLFDLIKEIASEAWSVISDVVNTIVSIAGDVGEVLGEAWDWVKTNVLGLQSSSSEGVWDWIKHNVGELWDEISPTVMAFVDPLVQFGKALLLFSPVGPLILAFRYGPRLIHWIGEVWNYIKDPNNLIAAAEYVSSTLLPGAISFVQEMSGAVQGVADQVIDALTQVSEPLGELVGALGGSMLELLTTAVESVLEKLQGAIDWAIKNIPPFFEKVAGWLGTLWQKVLRPILDVLVRVVWVIGNPLGLPMLFFSIVWEQIPYCLKAEIVSFVLDLLISFVEAMPDALLAVSGPLAPLIKHAFLGFLRAFRSEEGGGLPRTVAAMDRVVKLLGQGSLDFVLGFAAGLLKGIWDGLIGPFEMVFQLIEGVGKVIEWFRSVAGFEDGVPSHPTPAATQPAGPPAQPGLFKRLGERMQALWDSVRENFWPALRSVFTGEGGGDPIAMIGEFLSDAWGAITGAAGDIGAAIANALLSYFEKPDYELGHDVGWVAGMIIFTVVITALTAGAYGAVEAARGPLMAVVRVIVKIHKFTNEAFEAILGALPPIRRGVEALFHVVERMPGLRQIFASFKSLVQEVEGAAIAGLERSGTRAVGEATETTVATASRGEAAVAEHTPAPREPAATPHKPASTAKPETGKPTPGPHEPAPTAKPRAEEPAPGKSKTEESPPKSREEPRPVDETGHLEGPQLTQREIDKELQHIRDNPDLITGQPPNRRAKIGEHEWIEQPGGGWCRHSAPKDVICALPAAAPVPKADNPTPKPESEAPKPTTEHPAPKPETELPKPKAKEPAPKQEPETLRPKTDEPAVEAKPKTNEPAIEAKPKTNEPAVEANEPTAEVKPKTGEPAVEAKPKTNEPALSAKPEEPWVRPKNWRLPKNGTWTGPKGNSTFKPNNAAELGLEEGATIEFIHGEPQFEPFAVKPPFSSERKMFDVPGLTGDHAIDMALIDKEFARQQGWLKPNGEPNASKATKWRSDNKLTPHHAGGDSVLLVPTPLHDGVRHSGGAVKLRQGQ